ncbi:hypothetical protein NEOLEDRAFT_941115 [Neolentinus lepideus HHB14362 ss-1]|uniref:Uncharacterized protein n=1 Tax=Neolentinus lepideus HHB14362 ss-1 TaxID=1314782 RepID=A0A165NF09_9AGAM|nr:hypothetical protein NEOLEDRAFT_941115 [Neolentinus lepideus HHB14362 ss-1]
MFKHHNIYLGSPSASWLLLRTLHRSKIRRRDPRCRSTRSSGRALLLSLFSSRRGPERTRQAPRGPHPQGRVRCARPPSRALPHRGRAHLAVSTFSCSYRDSELTGAWWTQCCAAGQSGPGECHDAGAGFAEQGGKGYRPVDGMDQSRNTHVWV